jgi:hypothetical protein
LRCSSDRAAIKTRPSRAGFAYPAAELEQLIADFSRPDSAAQRVSKGFSPSVTIPDLNVEISLF